jgi:iron complex outermembrane receptor protein
LSPGGGGNDCGRLDPYFVANAQMRYQFKTVDLFFRLENMFDADYETYGAFFENTLNDTRVERFLGPGTPLGAFGGIRVKF